MINWTRYLAHLTPNGARTENKHRTLSTHATSKCQFTTICGAATPILEWLDTEALASPNVSQ